MLVRSFAKKALIILGSGSLLLAGIGATRARTLTPKSAGRVELFLSTDCPVAMQYSPRINRWAKAAADAKLEFVAYFPNEQESVEGVTTYATQRGFEFPCKLDPGAEHAKSRRINVIPTAVVLDASGKVVYHGALDDNKQVDHVVAPYLSNAIREVGSGRRVTTQKSTPFGCAIMPGKALPSLNQVTFAEHVAPIIYRNCLECHRPGEIGPFSLLTYDQARKWSENIAIATAARQMPPWKAVHGYGEFHDVNRLSANEIEILSRWAKAGAPEGNRSKVPKPPTFASEWSLGKPDLVLQPAKGFKVYAEGKDIYRHFVIKTNLKETVYVQAVDVHPGNRKVVHHVIAFLDEKGRAVKLNAQSKDGQEGYNAFGTPGFNPDGSFGGWAPGLRARRLPDGVGMELKPGTDIVLQIHYHPTGKEEVDQTKIALYFAKKPVEDKVMIAWLANPFFLLQPGNENQTVKASFTVPNDVTLYGVMPHMHLLGKSMKAWIELPGGETKPLIWVDRWDFNWQLTYSLKEPMKLPRGAKVRVEAAYDNSKNNPNQPNSPPKLVTWGEQTTDEMFLLVCVVAVGKQTLPQYWIPGGG